ncbi:MAG: peptidylprolyl isomerase [Planctomycetota bacterium]|jgi:parvulin-like peptidyl-prolyl isomerase
MRKCVFLIVTSLLLTVGCEGEKPKYTAEELAKIPLAQREGLPEISGGFVLVVSGETIASDEMIEVPTERNGVTLPLIDYLRPIAQRTRFEQFKIIAKPEFEKILVDRISSILLYQEAKKDMGEQIEEVLEKAAETEVRKFIVLYENDYAKAEEALSKAGMDWESFREYQKKMILSQSYLAKQLPDPKPVTYSELMAYYNYMKDELFATKATLRFRLIDIQPAKIKVTQANQDRQEVAKELAIELVRDINKGKDFGELAKEYSHGYRAMWGGLWKPREPNSLAEPYDILAAEAKNMKVGQVAGPIETAEHIFIMKLEEKQAATVEPFEKVHKQIEQQIISERQMQANEEFRTKLAQQASIGNKDAFVDFCLRKIYTMSNK